MCQILSNTFLKSLPSLCFEGEEEENLNVAPKWTGYIYGCHSKGNVLMKPAVVTIQFASMNSTCRSDGPACKGSQRQQGPTFHTSPAEHIAVYTYCQSNSTHLPPQERMLLIK